MTVEALRSLHGRLSSALASLETPRLQFVLSLDDVSLTVARVERDEHGITGMVEERLDLDVAAPLATASPERLAAWVAAWGRLQPRSGPLNSVVLVTVPSLESVDDFAAAMLDDDLVLAVLQQHDASWWGQETAWEQAWQAAGLGNFVVLEAMLAASPALASARGDGGFSLLHQVVERCDQFSARAHGRTLELLIARGADVNAATDEGVTPLHLARAELIAPLVKHGAKLEARTTTGMTPLLIQATEREGARPMQALLEAGADLDARDDAGQSAEDFARSRGEDEKLVLLSQFTSSR
ncbi:MAG: ankyrin repeat domain-containing protein [Myxococcaceae bacterium]